MFRDFRVGVSRWQFGVLHSGYEVFGSPVSGSGFMFEVSSGRCGVSCSQFSKFHVRGSWFSRFGVSGSGFLRFGVSRFQGSGFRVWVFWFLVWKFGVFGFGVLRFGVSSSGFSMFGVSQFRVWGLGFSVTG